MQLVIKEPYTCEICARSNFKRIEGLSCHIKRLHHMEQSDYYSTYVLKNENYKGECLNCSNPTTFHSLIRGYNEYCSVDCFWAYVHSHPEKQEQMKESRENTCFEKYGVKSYIKSNDFKEKSTATNLELYGVENGGASNQAAVKIKDTKEQRYGNANYNNSEKKELETLEKFRTLDTGLTLHSYHKKVFNCTCNTCNNTYDIRYQTIHNRLNVYKTTVCPMCNPLDSGISKEEKDVLEEVKRLYDGTILENDRTQIKPYELDIYLPDLKIAFEFNGDYWHSLNEVIVHDELKQKLCAEKNIMLVTITESDWLNNKEKVIQSIKDIICH